MINIDCLVDALKNRRLTDVFVTGYIDEKEGVKHFHPMFEDVYFEFESVLLKVSSIDQYWNLKINLVNNIHGEIEIDEDDEFCVGSIRHLLLNNPDGDNYLMALTVFVDGESQLDGGIVKRAAFQIGNQMGNRPSGIVFIDPENPYGIQLGGQPELLAWRENNLGEDRCAERIYSVN